MHCEGCDYECQGEYGSYCVSLEGCIDDEEEKT